MVEKVQSQMPFFIMLHTNSHNEGCSMANKPYLFFFENLLSVSVPYNFTAIFILQISISYI